MATASAPSFWLEQLGPLKRRPALAGDQEADVCIVGGGFTGLWTAYELRRADPGLRVVVLEAEHVGFGASGRNGGWVFGKISGRPEAWRRRGGPNAPAAMAQAIQRTVGEVGQAVTRERIDCDWLQGGSLTVARGEPQLARLNLELERLRQAGDTGWELIDARALRQRVVVEDGLGALYTPYCARVQPAKLAIGLARAAEAQGATIHESSLVLSIRPRSVSTAAGSVRAPHVVVATEGYTANLPGRHRALLPLNSAMIVTEPVPDELWAPLGWSGGETLLDGSYLFTYSQRTADGRVAIGGRGVPYRFGSRTDREGPVPAQTVRELRERLAAMFPALSEVAVSRAWHGVLGVSRDWCPGVGLDPATGLAFAGGYAGEGVAAANLAGRTLRDLILGRDTELTRLPWVGSGARNWEPEPLRFIGARGVYRLYREADRREQRTGRPSHVASLANAIAGR
ncbi:MAG: FAD-dependent oxidoreductase [Solirubrobacterales bacterium]|nr:FAD-dependent oxidoreductase [Solirubrobacterales bacterium]